MNWCRGDSRRNQRVRYQIDGRERLRDRYPTAGATYAAVDISNLVERDLSKSNIDVADDAWRGQAGESQNERSLSCRRGESDYDDDQ